MTAPGDAFGGPHRVIVELRWGASPLTRAVATCAGVAIACALLTARWELIAFAAPLLGVLCSIGWQRPVPTVQVQGQPRLQRCFESEQVQFNVLTDADDGGAVELDLAVSAGMELEVVSSQTGETTPGQVVAVQAARWGRYPVRAAVRVLGRGGLLQGTGHVDVAEICVFPVAPPQSTPIPRTNLLDRLGTHRTRYVGPGVEYAGIRPYVPGDQLRTVNWPVSARRNVLHVTERLTDRAADVIVLIDTYAQPPGPATDATERTARGAAQVVQSALRYGDRAGLVALGSRNTRWLGPEIGQRQFYRILDTILGAPDSFQAATGTLAPRAAVPPGAIVVAFSTMLETEFVLALIDLRKRGHAVVAVDVLAGSPLEGEHDPLVNRMWALERSFMYRDMATVGVDIVSWPRDVTLDQAMAPIPQHRTGARR
ncbi:hypothetical protein NGTWS0302_34600 [Mycolicibacterium cyprinidarum]|uniref:DUF58 domain-containing protein n=1 Tax=Mycolicibacterium cyprinidarum TaxID=2860311 RepID=A0ABQ4VBY7_9MYCO|nr:hypothetical protein NGTWS1803_18880 [Mycolicibacterium sp. NGTWS1803]GJF13742.1 hypothetical protein NGTWS0302_34600 [Mycolicibacterium sp. NGTWS0302]GJF18377.1 hypothetical protein NGTWS1702_26260 [Mycolicibacterium sp. NGTWSNA01]